MMRKEIKFPVNLLGISGKSSSGKDTVANIISWLIFERDYEMIFSTDYSKSFNIKSGWQIKKFASPVNDCYKVITGIDYLSLNREEKELHRADFRDFANKTKEVFGEDVWVNALMKDYKGYYYADRVRGKNPNNHDKIIKYPNWIISDVRFPNECEAITDRGGIVIRVNRSGKAINTNFKNGKIDIVNLESIARQITNTEHSSETALDNYNEFDYVIENDSDIPSLIEKVKEILIHFKIL